jgi:hypothetical protein
MICDRSLADLHKVLDMSGCGTRMQMFVYVAILVETLLSFCLML